MCILKIIKLKNIHYAWFLLQTYMFHRKIYNDQCCIREIFAWKNLRIKIYIFQTFFETEGNCISRENRLFKKKKTHSTFDTFHRICSDTVRDERKFRDLVTLNLEINFETQKTAFVQYYCEDEILNYKLLKKMCLKI